MTVQTDEAIYDQRALTKVWLEPINKDHHQLIYYAPLKKP